MTAPTAVDGELVLYRFFDTDGRLLYVGKSVNVWRRFKDHKRGSAFYPEAASVTLQRGFDSEDALARAEITAIQSESPRFNIAHNHNPEVAPVALPVASAEPATIDSPRWAVGVWNRVDFEADCVPLESKVVRVYRKNKLIAQGIVDEYDEGCAMCDEEGDEEGAFCCMCQEANEIRGEPLTTTLYLHMIGQSLGAYDVWEGEYTIAADLVELDTGEIAVYVWVSTDENDEINDAAGRLRSSAYQNATAAPEYSPG
jgi:hypothetical protein